MGLGLGLDVSNVLMLGSRSCFSSCCSCKFPLKCPQVALHLSGRPPVPQGCVTIVRPVAGRTIVTIGFLLLLLLQAPPPVTQGCCYNCPAGGRPDNCNNASLPPCLPASQPRPRFLQSSLHPCLQLTSSKRLGGKREA